MSKYWTTQSLDGFPQAVREQAKSLLFSNEGNRRIRDIGSIRNHFDDVVLNYLDEAIIDFLSDSLNIDKLHISNHRNDFHDFSFTTAPAYKAFEGYLFQIARDLRLSSAKPDFVGTFYDEEKIDKAVNLILKEFCEKSEGSTQLGRQEKQHIKDMISEMKRFLYHYRHTPAHYHSDRLQTVEKANQNVMSIYRIINETTKTLLRANLVIVNNEVH